MYAADMMLSSNSGRSLKIKFLIVEVQSMSFRAFLTDPLKIVEYPMKLNHSQVLFVSSQSLIYNGVKNEMCIKFNIYHIYD